ncbi:MAG: RNA-binding protein [Desulfurococcales archaeon]|uniref:RNA-binding protein n=1 Tax=Fervidicoccus fontis TaxID=683846 RepID=A0A7J3SLN4_9CREN|nr:YhbY family RNA-binding protein [Thermoprotei archaeon]NAY90250.1 RNA-binding protein [Desulfurococcales archaeon]
MISLGKNEIRIGKAGLSKEVAEEIKRRLEEEGEVMVRINKNLIALGEDRKEIAKKAAELVSAELVEVRGFTFILRKSKGGEAAH